MAPIKVPANGSAMGFIPDSFSLFLVLTLTLVYVGMAGVTQGGNPVVMGFDAHSFSVFLLIGVSGHYRPVLRPAYLTR